MMERHDGEAMTLHNTGIKQKDEPVTSVQNPSECNRQGDVCVCVSGVLAQLRRTHSLHTTPVICLINYGASNTVQTTKSVFVRDILTCKWFM